jgi:PTH2 family peptidyl-tRNA hydrolase
MARPEKILTKPVMYLFLNKGLGMSTGKAAAQVAHAAVEAFRLSESNLLQDWYTGGHYTKLVMEARDTEHLFVIKHYLEERGFKVALIIDEGRTEIEPHTPTALGVEVVDKNDPHTAATFESFRTYREDKPEEKPKKPKWPKR